MEKWKIQSISFYQKIRVLHQEIFIKNKKMKYTYMQFIIYEDSYAFFDKIFFRLKLYSD